MRRVCFVRLAQALTGAAVLILSPPLSGGIADAATAASASSPAPTASVAPETVAAECDNLRRAAQRAVGAELRYKNDSPTATRKINNALWREIFLAAHDTDALDAALDAQKIDSRKQCGPDTAYYVNLKDALYFTLMVATSQESDFIKNPMFMKYTVYLLGRLEPSVGKRKELTRDVFRFMVGQMDSLFRQQQVANTKKLWDLEKTWLH